MAARRGGKVASEKVWLTRLRLELAYLSGQSWFRGRKAGSAGVILQFERVRPRRHVPFQPLRKSEITPDFLDQIIQALKRWNYDIVTMDEACRRAVRLPGPRRFVCLTFDRAYKDVITSAYPILSRNGVPFTVYVATAFPDGVGEAWWLALEAIVAREKRLSLIIDGRERHFDIATTAEKYQLYEFLDRRMRSLPSSDLSIAINDLCMRYSVDLARLSRETSMDWADLAKLAADPLVTIGSATVNYPMLSNLKDVDASREITMGKAVAEAALHRKISHFAYPFGDSGSFRKSHVMMTEEAGFLSAASTVPGSVEAEGRTNLHALPRVAWDGRLGSLRALRVLLSGAGLPRGGPRELLAPRPSLDPVAPSSSR